MKKIILSTAGLFALSLIIISCSSESDVLSSFSKRKYLKNFKESKKTYEINIEEQIASVEEVKEIKSSESNTSNSVETIEESENNVVLTQETVQKAIALTPKKVSKQLEKEYRNWDKFNRNYSTELLASSKEYNYVTLNNSSARVNEIVLAILAIFIPPLAVFLFEDSITANFWVDLLLTLLFWLPGIIFAFLVIFAGVSL
ncbi:MAG: YqaE/Pmp3 family membrane protein [Flavobacteriales bacterium]|nr:YqaE/Pmp3 family membrane protein [Flavobacteriales bacterium]